MKLLIITQKVNKNDPILGFFHGWIIEFAKHFESITAICLEKGEYNLPANVKVLSLGKESGISRPKYLYNFYKYIWQERGNYDAVFVHMNPIYVLLGGLIWKFLSKKIYLWYTHKNVDLKLKIAVSFSSKVFSASKESFRYKTNKLTIMGHGIDTKIFCPRTDHLIDGHKIISVGRISITKNQHLLIEAFGLLVKNFPDVRLIIVGDAITDGDFAYKKQIIDRLMDLGLSNRVIFEGSVIPEKIVNYYRDADIFINLSSTGSLDKVVLESMASGNKILTSNEAFSSILPKENLTSNDPRIIADSIRYLFNAPKNESLRKIILSHHELGNLVDNLSKSIMK